MVFDAHIATGEVSERRRRAPRHQCSGRIRVSWTSGFDKFAAGECLEISRTGLRFATREPIPLMTRLCLKSESLDLAASGTVRHCKRNKGKYIVGVDFVGGFQYRAPEPPGAR